MRPEPPQVVYSGQAAAIYHYKHSPKGELTSAERRLFQIQIALLCIAEEYAKQRPATARGTRAVEATRSNLRLKVWLADTPDCVEVFAVGVKPSPREAYVDPLAVLGVDWRKMRKGNPE
jgi:hypothetical protein